MLHRLAIVVVVLVAAIVPIAGAQAHSGGLDSTGGHHCREQGYTNNKCAPLNSYHCHRSPCGEAAPTTQARTATTRRATTTAPPTTAAPTTTTTTEPPTTTTESTTTTVATTTSTTIARAATSLPARPTSSESEDEASLADALLGFVLLGGLGYGGYRGLRRLRAAR